MSSLAPSPTEMLPAQNPTTRTVIVEILSVKPNTDLEGDDDLVLGYDNKADIYGYVTIDGEQFNLRQIDDNDFPHWDESDIFLKEVSTNQVAIKIDIWEADSGATGDDDQVKICPLPDKAHLDLVFDLCSLQLSGDISRDARDVISESGGNGDDAATIEFRVRLKEDEPPLSTDDLSLLEVDLVQVRYGIKRLVARKPTLVMARLANTYSVDVTTNLNVVISGGGLSINDTFPVELKAGEIRKIYLYQDTPIRFHASGAPYPVAVTASLEDPGNSNLPDDDCRRVNDSLQNRIMWKVITTQESFSFLWAKVGRLLDSPNFTPDEHFNEIKELGHAYIEAVFPIVNASVTKSPFPLIPLDIQTETLEILGDVLSEIGIPADAFTPFVFLFQLNALPALTNYDRLMGVLPSHDWFKGFSFWEDVSGLSLCEFAPHAVIFLPRKRSEDGLDFGPQMTLPGHELGHTYGLSTDSRLKKSWLCDVDWKIDLGGIEFDVGSLACGATGGFDEYKHEDVFLQNGNPASGYWVPQGGEPATILDPTLKIVNHEQRDSHCLMGGSPLNAHLHWEDFGRWIDAADYDQLLDKLSLVPDPEVIYVSGMIAWTDQMYMGPIYHLSQGTPDREDSFGLYAVRFVDDEGKTLAEYGIPINWNTPEFDWPMPITFFGLKFPYSEGTKRIVFLNRGTNKILAEQPVSRHLPTVRIDSPDKGRIIQAGLPIEVAWEATDEDKDPLTYAVLVSTNRENWCPVVMGLSTPQFNLTTEVLEPGDYYLKVLAHDGVHVGESQHVPFRLVRE